MHKPILFATLLLFAGAAVYAEEAAPNADKRSLNLAVQRDGQRNQSTAAAVSLPVGRQAWVQLGAGQSRTRDAASGNSYRLGQVSVGGGVAGQAWQAGLVASHKRDGDALRQTDVAAAADWRPSNSVIVGVDATRRQARQRGSLPGSATPVEQRVKGHGVGLHGTVAVTQRLSVYGATMRNHYTTSTQQQSSGGLLAGLPLLQGGVSAVNRDEAALDRSHQLGATYRVNDRVALNGELQQDRLHEGGNLRSVQMKAAITAGAGWTVTPGLGRSHGPQGEGVNYGMLGASYSW